MTTTIYLTIARMSELGYKLTIVRKKRKEKFISLFLAITGYKV